MCHPTCPLMKAMPWILQLRLEQACSEMDALLFSKFTGKVDDLHLFLAVICNCAQTCHCSGHAILSVNDGINVFNVIRDYGKITANQVEATIIESRPQQSEHPTFYSLKLWLQAHLCIFQTCPSMKHRASSPTSPTKAYGTHLTELQKNKL